MSIFLLKRLLTLIATLIGSVLLVAIRNLSVITRALYDLIQVLSTAAL